MHRSHPRPPPSRPPISLERWVEVVDALDVAAADVAAPAGRDAGRVLRRFGLTPSSWARASEWWSRFFAQNAKRQGGSLYARYVQLRAELGEARRRGLTAGAEARSRRA
jgi:hypothetical protein